MVNNYIINHNLCKYYRKCKRFKRSVCNEKFKECLYCKYYKDIQDGNK